MTITDNTANPPGEHHDKAVDLLSGTVFPEMSNLVAAAQVYATLELATAIRSLKP